MEIDLLIGPIIRKYYGVARYQKEINGRIKDLKVNSIGYEPVEFNIRNKYFINFLKDIFIYPLKVKLNVKKENIKHINNQFYSYLLEMFKLEKTIITCYDLIPWIYENNHSFIWKFNIRGLKKADRIITISEYSKRDIIKYAGVSEDKIDVIYPAVDHKQFFKKREKRILDDLGISRNSKIILFVGSEQPRMNFDLIIKSLAELKKAIPNIFLIKIGVPQFQGAREKNLNLIKDLRLENNIIFIDQVSDTDLSLFYNAADLLVYPCSYAGFGLPPLEAMACGTPVITSNTTSLPEVVGNAGIMIGTLNIDEWVNNMHELLVNDALRSKLIKKGLKRAKKFNWDISAKKTLEVYKKF